MHFRGPFTEAPPRAFAISILESLLKYEAVNCEREEFQYTQQFCDIKNCCLRRE